MGELLNPPKPPVPTPSLCHAVGDGLWAPFEMWMAALTLKLRLKTIAVKVWGRAAPFRHWGVQKWAGALWSLSRKGKERALRLTELAHFTKCFTYICAGFWKQGLTERCPQPLLFPEERVRAQLCRAEAVLLREWPLSLRKLPLSALWPPPAPAAECNCTKK